MVKESANLLEEALAAHRQGNLAEARALYEAILAQDPKHLDALNMLGVVAGQTGNLEAAVEIFGKAIDANPARAASAHNNRGIALTKLNRLEEAVASYDRALALDPNYAEVHNHRGVVLQALGRLDEALASYERAATLSPGNADAFINCANTLSKLRRLDEALAIYDKALALKPGHADVHNSRGTVLVHLNRLDEAVASYDRALAIDPRHADAHNNRGNALKAWGQFDEALASYDKAVSVRPDYANAHYNRANLLMELNRLDEALASYDKALTLKPSDDEFLLGAVLHTRMKVCVWEGLNESIEKIKSSVLASKRVSIPSHMLTLLDDPQVHKRAAEIYAASKFPEAAGLGAIPKRARGGRLRVGYYSADFHNHATAYLMAELFEIHDSSRFEIFGFSFGRNRQDEMRKRVSAAIPKFIDVRGKSDTAIAQMSRELGIDIAVDLKGYTQDARPGIFAERCAPLQVSYLGYPGTLGAPYVDYILADKTVIPLEHQADFTEKVVCLPHSYQVNDSRRKIADVAFARHEFGLPETAVVFCCFNNAYKISPEVFDVWMRVLKSVDGSVLWLLEDHPTAVRNLRKEAQVRGVDGARLVFARRMPLDRHLARHRLADLFLDTLPYNAHTTASDALWAGLPVLTRAGKSFAARVAASLLHALDLPELVTNSREDYEAEALSLARDRSKLSAIRGKLNANRLSKPLFDTKLFAKHLESAYIAIYERYQAGLAPESIAIPPADGA